MRDTSALTKDHPDAKTYRRSVLAPPPHSSYQSGTSHHLFKDKKIQDEKNLSDYTG